MELDLREGWVATELAEEFPELSLTYAPLEAKPFAARTWWTTR